MKSFSEKDQDALRKDLQGLRRQLISWGLTETDVRLSGTGIEDATLLSGDASYDTVHKPICVDGILHVKDIDTNNLARDLLEAYEEELYIYTLDTAGE